MKCSLVLGLLLDLMPFAASLKVALSVAVKEIFYLGLRPIAGPPPFWYNYLFLLPSSVAPFALPHWHSFSAGWRLNMFLSFSCGSERCVLWHFGKVRYASHRILKQALFAFFTIDFLPTLKILRFRWPIRFVEMIRGGFRLSIWIKIDRRWRSRVRVKRRRRHFNWDKWP